MRFGLLSHNRYLTGNRAKRIVEMTFRQEMK
jgi:hypothetical protein